MDQHLSFFWEQKSHLKGRSRFNLLHLEHGEYFLEDFSVFWYPFPDESSGKLFYQCESLKVQGRLKLCSRSLIFEPSDVGKPITKYMFKSFRSRLVEYRLSKSDHKMYGGDLSGFFSFRSCNIIELMENGKVGPYRLVEYEDRKNGNPVLFSLVHSELSAVLTKIETLYNIYLATDRDGDYGQINHVISSAATNSFDTSQLVDFHETLLLSRSIPVKKIKPLIVNFGCIMVTDRRIYFQPAQLNNVSESVQHFEYSKIANIYRRRYLLRHSSFEIIMRDGSSAFFCFDAQTDCEHIFSTIQGFLKNDITSGNGQASDSAYRLEHAMRKWQRRELSTFEYLMFLNNEADRSMNDLTQYPVFPHIIADFKSPSLDLKSSSTFRDLSKPIGALNPSRLTHLKQRFLSMPEEDPVLGIPPPFLYGTHYSTPGYVLHYLVRVAPEYMLCLQNGKFDAPDRTFLSVADSWESCLNNPADLKELIPEFFIGNGEFLNNLDDLDLGHRHNGERLNDVDIPVWAKSARDFIRKNAKALESDYVSSQIHNWIDLIFGYKQRGIEAKNADNVFYYLTYEGAVDIDKETDPRRRYALEMQIQEFGQTPKQLFKGPHPSRSSTNDEAIHDCLQGLRPTLATTSDALEKLMNLTAPSEIALKKVESSSAVKSKDEVDLLSGGIQLLGDDFKEEVTREIRKESTLANIGKSLAAADSIFRPFIEQTLGSKNSSPSGKAPIDPPAQAVSTSVAPVQSTSLNVDIPKSVPAPTRTSVTPNVRSVASNVRAVSIQSVSDSFTAHREGITGLSMAHNHRSTVCSCSRDATMKVISSS
jgi:factor associated with neutral sphingomyelinase activation